MAKRRLLRSPRCLCVSVLPHSFQFLNQLTNFHKTCYYIMTMEEDTTVPYTADVWTCMIQEILAPLIVRT